MSVTKKELNPKEARLAETLLKRDLFADFLSSLEGAEQKINFLTKTPTLTPAGLYTKKKLKDGSVEKAEKDKSLIAYDLETIDKYGEEGFVQLKDACEKLFENWKKIKATLFEEQAEEAPKKAPAKKKAPTKKAEK